MIRNREELKKCLAADRARTEVGMLPRWIRGFVCREFYFLIWCYIKALRMEEYHTGQKGFYHRLFHYFWRRKRNRYGEKTGIFLEPEVCGPGLCIWHNNVVVNSRAVIGRNCTFHGNNCVGNDGFSQEAPVLGNSVTLGTGASVIGDVTLADGITVGAGAVVLHSFHEPGITLVGIPARPLKRP